VSRIRDWIVSIPTAAAFGLVLGIGDVVQRVTFRMGMGPYERALGSLHRWLIRAFRIAGVRVIPDSIDGIEDRGGYIVISNHQSMFDISIYGALLAGHTPRFVSKRSLAKGIPTVSFYLKHGGNALIDRGDREQAMEAIKEMGVLCQERGKAAVIYPEGTRSRDGSLGDYRIAGASALMEAAPGLPVLPAVIDGSWKVFENNLFPIAWGTRVRVRFGTPIERTPDEVHAAVIDQCREFAEATLAEWHRGQPPAH
jgi:1-acyl-sn-glycerol-3-phosphate acyltransferase